MNNRVINVAIDGPSGAGKSTAARLAAAKLGFLYVDTGALYRCLALAALRAGLPPTDAAAVEALLPRVALELRFVEGVQHVFLGEEDVSEAIRTPEASLATSAVSAQPAVRAFLLERQRALAKAQNCILDGRDIGTVVLPGAQVKIFLTASPEERAARRHAELQKKGNTDSYEKVLEELIRRDEQDSGRAIAPLKPAPGSILLDSTGKTLEQVVDAIVQLIHGV
ncbi:MAG: (d)CMP kinase [Oscillospiraceae bacterium]|jgi:cytidylate kinase|nr:(d)CMP kinase [Oscillospiraceae bacterium]